MLNLLDCAISAMLSSFFLNKIAYCLVFDGNALQ